MNKKGFTIVETLIGLMILTTAIVAATSMLIGLIHSNDQIVKTLQAHYLAQEGLEGVRNVRDTNWMHNLDWESGDSRFLGGFAVPDTGVKQYSLGLKFGGLNSSSPTNVTDLNGLNKTWDLKLLTSTDTGKIYLCSGGYFSTSCEGRAGTDSGFTRIIEISKPVYCSESNADLELCKNVMLVRSIVKFGKNNEVSLEEILTNWKGGAL